MRAQGISTLEVMAPSIPNLHHAQATISSDIFTVRGVGTSGSNVGFEQAVGMVYNGFFFGRSRFGRSTFLDLDRLEVLRGPQGALVGKNTSAGAISFVPRKPTEAFEGYARAGYNFEGAEGTTIEGTVSGPLSDSVRGRVAVRYDDFDGWVKNNNTGKSEQRAEDLTARFILEWDITDRLGAEFMYHYGDFQHEGRNREWSACSPANATSIPAADPMAECSFDAVRSTIFVFDGETIEEPHDTEFDLYGLTLNWSLDAFEVTSLTSYSEYNADDVWDIDQSIVERTNAEWHETYEQFQQELRISSSGGQTLDFLAGIFYQATDMDFSSPFNFHRGPSSGQRNRTAQQESDTFAVFGQVDWRLSDAWTLTVGGRYTDEEKDGYTSAWYSALYDASNVRLAPGVVVPGFNGRSSEFGGNSGAGFATLTQDPTIGDNVLRDTRSESNFSPNASLQWQFADEQMIYFNVAKGFKSGGFDLQSVAVASTAGSTWQFDEEESTHFELGGKHLLASGLWRVNWALFSTEFKDLQVSALDGLTLIQFTTNAATATTQGLEVELLWAPTEQLNLGLNFALLDASYDDFPNAPCWAGQPQGSGQCNPVDLDGDGSNDGNVQDLSGENLAFSAESQFTFDIEYLVPIGNLELLFGAQYYWVDDMFLALDHDPNDTQKSYGKLNARVQLSGNDGQWSISLVGRNLTDELTANFANDTAALVGGAAANGTHFKFSEPTRTVGVQVRFNFD